MSIDANRPSASPLDRKRRVAATRRRLAVERMEDRILLSNITVTAKQSSDPGITLNDAIQLANTTPGPDNILFSSAGEYVPSD